MDKPALKEGSAKFSGVNRDVQFENVRFAYGEKEILHGVSLELKQGTTTALVGESGSGKSTLAKMVLKLLEAGSGDISLGGEDLSVYDKKKKEAYAPRLHKRSWKKTAKADFTDVDDYGVYKVGSFLYRNAFVTISKEDGLWTLHVISEAPIGLPLIKEVRYKYLPNNLMMAQIFGDRAEANEIKGVILYQIPNGEMEAE